MKNIMDKKELIKTVRDSMYNRFYMLDFYRPYIYVETVVSDIDVELNKYYEDEDTKE